MRLRHLLLTVALPLVAAPVGALAATVTGTRISKLDIEHSTFRAAPGEANDVTVGRLASGEAHFVDAGAPLEAGERCRQIGPSEAACPPPFLVTLHLDDRADRVRASLAYEAHGGEGADVLSGSPQVDGLHGDAGDDTIEAGDGLDYLWGGDGGDTLDGGRGNDVVMGDGEDSPLSTATPERDVLRGGDGVDVVSYAGHRVPVRVDLSRPGAAAGAEGERDALSGFEGAKGGRARADLIGTDAANELELQRGGVAIGGGGSDHMAVGTDNVAGTIAAVVDAGAGSDRVTAVFTRGARIACGPGSDLVEGRQAGTLAPDCERIALVGLTYPRPPVLRPHPRLRGSRAVFRVPCPEVADADGPCRGHVLLRDRAGATVGRRRYDAEEGTRPSVAVKLSRDARRRMARRGGLEVQVELLMTPPAGEGQSGLWSVVLKAP